jgi:hypothetical protein
MSGRADPTQVSGFAVTRQYTTFRILAQERLSDYSEVGRLHNVGFCCERSHKMRLWGLGKP